MSRARRVSNENVREVGSSCIAERRGIERLDEGARRGRRPLFDPIDQCVVVA